VGTPQKGMEIIKIVRAGVEGIGAQEANHICLSLSGQHCSQGGKQMFPTLMLLPLGRTHQTSQAMVRLNAHPEKSRGIRVENCGLLFLGTPHSGTVQADWNDFVAGIAVLFGIRFDVVDSLRSFNGFGVESKEAFRSLPQQPPYFCLCETKMVTIAAGVSRLVSFESSY